MGWGRCSSNLDGSDYAVLHTFGSAHGSYLKPTDSSKRRRIVWNDCEAGKRRRDRLSPERAVQITRSYHFTTVSQGGGPLVPLTRKDGFMVCQEGGDAMP